jgi:protein subunit release factor A
MKESDIRIDTYCISSPIAKMRLMHIPTGLSVHGETERSILKLKYKLMKELEEKVNKSDS